MRTYFFAALALLASAVAASATPIAGNYTVTSSRGVAATTITNVLADPFNLNLVLNVSQTFDFATIKENTAGNSTITASFTFTSPTGSLNDTGSDVFTVTGNGSGNHDNLTWTTNLNHLVLGDGSHLDLTLADASYNGNASSYVGVTPKITFTLVQAGTGTPNASVPEPLTLSLFGAGLVGAAALRRRKSKKVAA